MDFFTLLLDHLYTLVALACALFLVYGAGLVFDSQLPRRDPEIQRRQNNFYGD
jgi:hypothetical protein